MKRTPYKYLIYIGMTTVSLAVFITGIFLINYSLKGYQSSKLEEVSVAGELYIRDVQENYSQTGSLDTEFIKKLDTIFTHSCNTEFIIYDEEGQSIKNTDNPKRSTLSYDIIQKLDNDVYLAFDSENVSAYEPTMCYGSKFKVRYKGEEARTYYLMSYVCGKSISNFSQGLLTVFVVIFIILFVIAGGLFSLVAQNAGKPVLEIERISEKYARGDFSEKLEKSQNTEFDSIYASFNKMAEFIESNENTSKNFIANVSHELRTPMTTIGGFVDGILDGVIPESKQNEYLSIVSQEIKRLRILISSMLNMTKFEAGNMKPNFTETNITELVIRTVFMFEQKIEVKKVDIEGLDAERLIVEADENLIEQVIYNLIENAVKFVNKEGIISFEFRKNESSCFINIKNTGEGLTDTEISQVFDRFYKTDSSRGKDTTGLGLGLSISRRIIQLHNGDITVKSIYGKYTEFIIELPLKQPKS
ncbi:MAG TPA: sensor histidine kinase [Ruminococcus sp.]|nr:sensor histidine kinase [Ruminococcus sp.]